MKATKATKMGRLRTQAKLDIPLAEVSGVCSGRGRDGEIALAAISDREATLAWTRLSSIDADSVEWRRIDLTAIPGSALPAKDPQIEAICADGAGRVLLVQETPPRAELVDTKTARVVASIQLTVEGHGELARSWSKPQGSRSEGAVLLPGGHLLVAKEKDPAVLIEFGPAGARSQGLVQGGALAAGAAWPIEPGEHEFHVLAIWRPDATLKKVCEDFSDLEIGPDGRLYALSDQSAAIARLDDLPPGGGAAALTAWWKLDKLKAKPEGLAFDASGRAIVALDKRKPRKNLVVLEPAIVKNQNQENNID